MKEKTQRRIFLIIAYGIIAAFFIWQILDYVLFVIKDPSNAVVHNNWIHLIVFGVYFAVGYCLVFLKGWSKIPPANDAWPPVRCYGLLLWGVLSVLPTPPLCGPDCVRVHIVTCVVVDILFLIRIIIGRIRNETGWSWQIYAMFYIWIAIVLPALAVSLIL